MAVRGVWQLQRLIVRHCDFGGSSRGAREFVEALLPQLISENPQLTVDTVVKRGHHPLLQAQYANGRERVVGVKNEDAETIMVQALRLRNSTGRKVVKLGKRQETNRPSIQGPWNPELQSKLREEMLQSGI
eukprot:TRINITY_DN80710_c0_g1_i1.p1 TRINITY_DN80710_c0_g1~~TRINITY_DN80710_c0_g1_i1.p1  ORF type:complete len:131 (-),score=6.25 TRINITY_DN80710_c0_g1_i1:54-446(-)